MHPELYLVLYRQQERELEATLRRRLLQTCCAALATMRRPRWSSLVERVSAFVGAGPAARRAGACCA